MRFMIPNWEKYNPRADYKSMPWFRMDCNLPLDHKVVGLTGNECWTWVVVLCIAARENKGGVFAADAAWIAMQSRIPLAEVEIALKKFQDLEMIKIDTYVKRTRRVRDTNVSRTSDDRMTDVPRSLRNGTERNETERNETERNSTVDPPSEPVKPTFSEADLAVGSEWLQFALQEMPWKGKDKSWTPDSFAEAIAKVRRAMVITEEGMAKILDFVRADDFWRKNAVSPSGLLKRSDRNGNRKIDNILLRMKAPQSSVAGQAAAAMKWAEG